MYYIGILLIKSPWLHMLWSFLKCLFFGGGGVGTVGDAFIIALTFGYFYREREN